ncbi:MAG TPA: sugar ABC transporter ATP-binding protein [Rugosimonospora sp.]|nr:sugar ABC transporter ATP-binding protein [Rugosimonospora sp.]
MTTAPPPVLAVTGLTKRFGGTLALDGVDLSLRPGKVHALLGGNGSGKSTAIKILAGVHHADAGQVRVRGTGYDARHFTARHAAQAGLRFVHQDLGLFPGLSVAENFALDAGYPVAPGRRIRWSALRRRVRQVLDAYEVAVDPGTPINALRPAERTMVAIARALQDQEGAQFVLVLDEPTASLAEHESTLLLRAVRRRAERGQTVLLVSHRLQEVLSVADDFTVFRDGRNAGTLLGASPTEDDIIAMMAGGGTREGVGGARLRQDPAPGAGRDVLRVSGLHAGPLRGIDLTLHEGEIVGVAGLVGSGRSTLLRSIFGDRPHAGTVTLDGAAFAPGHAGAAMRRGVAYVPEDRAGEAAFSDLAIRDNLSASVLPSYWRPWGMPRRTERRDSLGLMRRFGIKAASPDVPFSTMSGGNQQKTVLARWLRRRPRVLLLDEPTQGVDVVARADIYRTIRDTAALGCAVLVASSDFVELAGVCDRVLILRAGRIAGQLARADVTADRLTELVQSTAPIPGGFA